MNKILNEYNNKIGSLCLKIGKASLLSPSLCRTEAQSGLFRSIFINNPDKRNILRISFKDIIKYSFGIFIKIIRILVIV